MYNTSNLNIMVFVMMMSKFSRHVGNHADILTQKRSSDYFELINNHDYPEAAHTAYGVYKNTSDKDFWLNNINEVFDLYIYDLKNRDINTVSHEYMKLHISDVIKDGLIIDTAINNIKKTCNAYNDISAYRLSLNLLRRAINSFISYGKDGEQSIEQLSKIIDLTMETLSFVKGDYPEEDFLEDLEIDLGLKDIFPPQLNDMAKFVNESIVNPPVVKLSIKEKMLLGINIKLNEKPNMTIRERMLVNTMK